MAEALRADVLVAGGGMGGVAAALAVARQGLCAVLTEETPWIGGQLTSQGVAAPDEHPHIEAMGATASYQAFRRGVRAYYAAHYPLLPDPGRLHLNPGNGTVSRLCHEPRVALAVLEQLLAPHRAAGRVRVRTGLRPLGADVRGDRVGAVTFADVQGGPPVAVEAPYVIDATELGEVLPLAGAEYRVGAEARAETGEPHAPEQADPQDVQAFTWCAVLEHRPGEDHRLERPEGYAGFAAGGHLDWVQPHPLTGEPRTYGLFPDPGGAFPLWTYRRLLDRSQFLPGAFASDLTLVNWPQNDYLGGSLIDCPPEQAAWHARQARALTLSLVHWLQAEAPRPDGGRGYPGLRLRGDVLGSADGLALAPYVRESRRILAVAPVLEQHIAAGLRATAEPYPDSVGIGLYRIDLHPSARRRQYLDLPCCPFRIPLGALLPVRLRNLLPGCKDLGATHITAGAYRLHPVEWNIGEAAGALAAHCLRRQTEPHAVREDPARLAAFQDELRRQGVPLQWPQATAL